MYNTQQYYHSYGYGIQQYFSYIMTVSFIGEGKPEYMEKITDPPQVADKVHHIKLFRVHLVMSGIQTHNYSG